MNIQTLTSQEITLLEMFLNNYKHARNHMRQNPKSLRHKKSIRRNVFRFRNWIILFLEPAQKQFLAKYGLNDALGEVNNFIEANYRIKQKINL